VAKADFSLWPHSIASLADFNNASRAELVVSALALDGYVKTEFQPADLGIKSIHGDSLRKWEESAKREWIAHFIDASADCTHGGTGCGFKGGDWDAFVTFAKRVETRELSIARYALWLDNTRRFYASYLKEQIRLAALFPYPTSEIMTLSATEIVGGELKDRQFALSFDDGPTAPGRETERYISLLDQNRISAWFFVLGGAMERRLKATPPEALRRTYSNQCLASHGYEHKPHPRMTDWKESLKKTNALITQVFPETGSAMFRPPYGQRQQELIQFLDDEGAHVVLWNIDSQDWHSRISADEVASRVKKLMLLKRRGILLFHDVHAKGLTAIPEIIEFARRAGLTWADCHEIKPAGVRLSHAE
jgi:peptidoglycan/xylan/chitin deacetylase (PgdA/CDA1 family)